MATSVEITQIKNMVEASKAEIKGINPSGVYATRGSEGYYIQPAHDGLFSKPSVFITMNGYETHEVLNECLISFLNNY